MVEERLSYGSFVADKNQIVFVETPKAGCTSLKWILAYIEGYEVPKVAAGDESTLEMCIHYRAINPLRSLPKFPSKQLQKILSNPAYQRICVVRNPYHRLASAWADKIRQIEPGYAGVCRDILTFAGTPKSHFSPTFAQFARWVVATNDPYFCDPHWRVQRGLLLPEILQYSHVIRMEHFDTDLQHVFDQCPTSHSLDARALLAQFRFNASLPINLLSIYDESLAQRVAKFYADDFEEYGYDFDSWRDLASSDAPNSSKIEASALAAIQKRNRVIDQLAARIQKLRNNQKHN